MERPSVLQRWQSPEHWLNRIAVVIALFVLVVMAVSAVAATEPMRRIESIGMLSTMMIWIAVAGIIVFDEWRQPAGDIIATGITATKSTPALIMRGALWAATMLAVAAGVGLVLGGHFQIGAAEVSPLAVVMIIVSAIGEELLFRTTVLRVLHDRFGSFWAVMITSALFSAAHGGNPAMGQISSINTFIVAVAFGIVTLKSGSIWIASTCHLVWNLLVAAVFGPVSGIDPGLSWMRYTTAADDHLAQLLMGDAYGVESGLVCTGVLIISLAMIRHIIAVDPYVVSARYRISFTRAAYSNRSATEMELTNGE